MKLKYITKLEKIPQIDQWERQRLETVHDEYAFRTNDYYNSLINWDDPNDPIRKIAIPDVRELDKWGSLDASNEEAYTKAPGLQHKYQSTAILLVNDVCGAYCRFCFRKRLFMNINDEVTRDVSEGLTYIRDHTEINNVLLTGGDPLVMATAKLDAIISKLRAIPHVKVIRIGSKMLAFNPFRISEDEELLRLLARHSQPEKRIHIMAHFNHPRELTKEARHAISLLIDAGVMVVNQTPLLRGINDNPKVLAELFNELSFIGVPPYYLFQCRPTSGNKLFSVPIEQGLDIFEEARGHGSGLAKRARYVMSHETGKIEIVGKAEGSTFFKYHRVPHEEGGGAFLVMDSNPEALWLDDYPQAAEKLVFGWPLTYQETT